MPQDPNNPNNQSGQADIYGPFTGVLAGPAAQPEQMPQIGYPPSGGGALAMYVSQFLRGAQQGQRRKYEMDERNKLEAGRNFDSVYQSILNNPNISADGKKAAQQAWYTAKFGQMRDHLGGAKDVKDNPLIGFTKSIVDSALGPSTNKNHPMPDVNSLLSIATHPDYQIDPQKLENNLMSEMTGAMGDMRNRPAPTIIGTGPNGMQLPMSGTIPNDQPITREQLLAHPRVTTAMNAYRQATGQEPTQLPSVSAFAGSVPVAQSMVHNMGKEAGYDPSTIDADHPKGRYFNWHNYSSLYGVQRIRGEELPDPDMKTTSVLEQQTANLIRTAQKAHPDWSPEQVQTYVAKTQLGVVEKKGYIAPTQEEQLSRYLVDSGKYTDPAQAKTAAAGMLVDLQQATIAAKKNAGNQTQSAFTPEQLDALARWSIATGQSVNFGMGKSADRTAYNQAVANTISYGGIGDALAMRDNSKALQTSLTNMTKLRDTVGSFEKGAEGNIDNAVAAAKAYPRTGSSLANAWTQWITSHVVDDPALKDLMVKAETAANEYARVVSGATNGGISTNAAREQANNMISSALAEGSFEAAANAMKTDMRTRMSGINQTIAQLQDDITGLGTKKPPTGGAGGANNRANNGAGNAGTISVDAGNGRSVTIGRANLAQFLRDAAKEGHRTVTITGTDGKPRQIDTSKADLYQGAQ